MRDSAVRSSTGSGCANTGDSNCSGIVFSLIGEGAHVLEPELYVGEYGSSLRSSMTLTSPTDMEDESRSSDTNDAIER